MITLKKRYNSKLTFQNIDDENVSELINNLFPKTSLVLMAYLPNY